MTGHRSAERGEEDLSIYSVVQKLRSMLMFYKAK